MTLAHTTVLPTSSSLSSQLTVLHDGLAYPVDPGIPSYGFVHGIDHDDFVVHIRRILTYPVRTQHTKSTSQPSCSLFSLGPGTTLKLYLVDSLTFWFTVCCSLGSVSESLGFVRTCGS